MRKYVLGQAEITTSSSKEIDCLQNTAVGFTSADPANPVENLFDGDLATCWSSASDDRTEQILITFDAPKSLTKIVYEVIEREFQRTQEVQIEVSVDGENFRRVFVQEYVFSPSGANYEKQDLKLEMRDVSALRLTVIPNKNGSGRAKLTSLHLFEWI